MASRLLTRRVVFMPNLRAAVKHFRAFSSYNGREQNEPQLYFEDKSSDFVWPDQKLGPFQPRDKRFPLPGLVGPIPVPRPEQVVLEKTDLFQQIPSERHSTVIEQAEAKIQEDLETEYIFSSNPDDQLELVVQQCPQLLKRDFADLFPDRNILCEPLTVITFSQKTQNDMTGWSVEVEEEREQLLDSFVAGATEICEALKLAGFWADFIDPSSGKPYIGPHTNSTLFETDERYRKLGFEIDDLGCCKVIRHHVWGTHSYVGCLFTNAPADHPLLQEKISVANG